MNFRTEITLPKSEISITHKQKILLLGSCFTDNIGRKLVANKFQASLNPFGVLYNPFSINKHLQKLLFGTAPQLSEIKSLKDVFLHFDYHSSFSDTDKTKALNAMQKAFYSVNLNELDVLFLTWGTSRIYRLKENNDLVANCHKFPQSYFNRKDTSVQQIVDDCSEVFSQLKTQNPALKIVLNVSPVRHLKDGFVENQRNKVRLLLAAEILEQSFDFVSYFPSYEMLMDDLRDYRFYASDLVHPSDEAVEYIWQKFSDHYFMQETQQLLKDISPILQAVKHKIFFPESEETRKFVSAHLKKIENLSKTYPELDFSKETKYFSTLMSAGKKR